MISHDLDSLCLTWRHDFEHLSLEEKNGTRRLLREIHDYHVAPLLRQLAAEQQALAAALHAADAVQGHRPVDV